MPKTKNTPKNDTLKKINDEIKNFKIEIIRINSNYDYISDRALNKLLSDIKNITLKAKQY